VKFGTAAWQEALADADWFAAQVVIDGAELSVTVKFAVQVL
jgi:hypothetical protein